MVATTRVKMCGMTCAEDMAQAINLGVHALGFIFYEKSARFCSIEHAKALLQTVPPFVDTVAVLVNPQTDLVRRIVNELPIKLLQFHGDEDAAFCQKFNKPYIKAIHPYCSEDIINATNEFDDAQAILLDTPSSARGGSGQVFDWQIIPKKLTKRYILAGGLNEFNIREAIHTCTPYAVDICSGIEALPGIKDHIKMSRFMTALWDAEHEQNRTS